MNRGSSVVTVTGVVNATAFNHQEESFRGGAQAAERNFGHLGERRRGSLEFGGIHAVDLEGDVALTEETEQRCLADIGQQLVSI